MRCIADAAPRASGPTFPLPIPVRLRGFLPKDVPAIAAIVAEALYEHYDSSLYLSLSQAWPDGFLVATDALDRPVGFLLGVGQVPGEARVLMFAIAAAHRHQGIGRKLMEEFFVRARRRSTARVTLEVRVGNVNAIRFYTRFGFSVTDLLKGYYSDGEDGYQMGRPIV